MAEKIYHDVDFNQNLLMQARLDNLATAPVTPVTGQIYFDTVLGYARVWDGSIWIDRILVISDLTDVNTTGVSTVNKYLVWNDGAGEWQADTITAELDELDNVTIVTPLNEQVLTYETSSSKWKNVTPAPVSSIPVEMLEAQSAGVTLPQFMSWTTIAGAGGFSTSQTDGTAITYLSDGFIISSPGYYKVSAIFNVTNAATGITSIRLLTTNPAIVSFEASTDLGSELGRSVVSPLIIEGYIKNTTGITNVNIQYSTAVTFDYSSAIMSCYKI